MQQTEKYKLNLIETSDTFSPNPLNENAQKLEAAITAGDAAEANARAAADTALDQRLTAVEAHRIVCGNYISTGIMPSVIQLGLTPKAVFLFSTNTSTPRYGLAIPDYPVTDRGIVQLEIINGGFRLGGDTFNRDSLQFNYLALV